jgi:hypothetical protein
MAISISGDTPNFSAATITTVTSTTLSDGTNSTSSTNAIQGSAKAWVNWDGQTSPNTNIRASYNVSSITYTSTGLWTINLTNALADANAVCLGTSEYNYLGISTGDTAAVAMYTSSSARYQNSLGTGSNRNPAVCQVAIFR